MAENQDELKPAEEQGGQDDAPVPEKEEQSEQQEPKPRPFRPERDAGEVHFARRPGSLAFPPNMPRPEPMKVEPIEEYDPKLISGGFFSKFRIVDALLKQRDSVFLTIKSGKGLEDFLSGMLLIVIAFGAVYGVIMGMYEGGIIILYAAVKVPMLILFSMLICLPTFYIFNSMMGSKLTLWQTVPILTTQSVMTAIILLGFAPIIWFFTVSLGTYGFMIFLHVAVFGLASLIGAKYVSRALSTAQDRSQSEALFLLWFVVYFFVLCQMAAYLQPFMSGDVFFEGKRMFFLEFLGNILKDSKDVATQIHYR